MDATDALHESRASHNPSVVGSIPTGPTVNHNFLGLICPNVLV